MHDVLHPLTLQSGVRLAAVISGDGVPVCVLERSSSGTDEFVDCTTSSQPALEGQRIDPASFVALAASWVDDLMRAGGQIAWEVPRRFVLVASQGTLVVQRGPDAHVMVVLESVVAPESMVLPLEAAVERLHLLLQDLGRFDPDQNAPALPRRTPKRAPSAPSRTTQPAGADPGRATLTDATGGPSAAAGGYPNGTADSAHHDSTGDH